MRKLVPIPRRTVLLSLACAAGTPAIARAAEPGLTRREFLLLEMVNRMRRDRGLKSLALSADLSRAARAFAERMAREGFFAHEAPAGDGPTERADEVGYDWSRLGETLAAGQKTAAGAAFSWRDSPGHAAIIFDPENVHAGVGHWRRGDDDKAEHSDYWVLMAGAPR